MSSNPFKPTFGVDPLVFAGRTTEVKEFSIALMEGVGSPYRTLLISGPRGSGKTVLLNQLEHAANESGWIVLRGYANDSLIEDLVETQIPAAQAHLDYAAKKGTRISGISVAGLGSITTESAPADGGVPVRPTLITRLHDLFEVAKGKAAGVLITIDELQSAPIEQIAKVAVAVQDLMRDEYDIAFVGAGLTFGVENLLDEPGTTFMRRALRIELGPVSDEDVQKSFVETSQAAGKAVDGAALDLATAAIKGYPYLLQLVGSKAWALSEMRGGTDITEHDITEAHGPVISQMGQQIHKIALRKVSDSELNYLEAMAEIAAKEGTPVDTAAIAQHMGKTQAQTSPVRRKLIERDLVFVPRRGELDFRLPYLGEYLLAHK